MKDEHHVKIEKGTLLGAGIILITAGVEKMTSGAIYPGAIMVCVGLFIMFSREHFKFHRWGSKIGDNSYWRGESNSETGGGL